VKWQEEIPQIGEKRDETKCAVESYGLPVGVVISGANRHDIKLLEAALQSIVAAHPEGMNLCLNAGYAGTRALVEGTGYTVHIRGRGEEKTEKKCNPLYEPQRRVVEVCHSRMNRFRKLLARYEKKAGNYQALLPVPLLSGETSSRSIRALFPDKF
jgi:putative transposase